jgi:hypothetical protein
MRDAGSSAIRAGQEGPNLKRSSRVGAIFSLLFQLALALTGFASHRHVSSERIAHMITEWHGLSEPLSEVGTNFSQFI